MKYHVFLSDFDGTLVRADGTISERNIDAIRAYREAGGIFAVVTGRMPSAILPRLKELGLESGLVCAYQGAAVIDIATGNYLRNGVFSQEDALRVLNFLEEMGYHIHVYTGDTFYSNMDDALLKRYEHVCKVKAKIEAHLSDMVASNCVPVSKILVMVPASECRKTQALLEGELTAFYVTSSSENLVEVMPKGQNKAAAVAFFEEYFHVEREQIDAIGDQLNDLPMLEAAGKGFAVKNAGQPLKERAHVVASCEEDGVAEAIEIAMGVRYE